MQYLFPPGRHHQPRDFVPGAPMGTVESLWGKYTQEDSDSEADVAFFIDTNNVGFDGAPFHGCEPETESAWVETELSELSQFESGTYYVYGCIFDGHNAYCDYGEQSFTLP